MKIEISRRELMLCTFSSIFDAELSRPDELLFTRVASVKFIGISIQ